MSWQTTAYKSYPKYLQLFVRTWSLLGLLLSRRTLGPAVGSHTSTRQSALYYSTTLRSNKSFRTHFRLPDLCVSLACPLPHKTELLQISHALKSLASRHKTVFDIPMHHSSDAIRLERFSLAYQRTLSQKRWIRISVAGKTMHSELGQPRTIWVFVCTGQIWCLVSCQH